MSSPRSQSVIISLPDDYSPARTRRRELTFPDKFKDGADAQSDVAAPRTSKGRYINQSFISLIANVGSSASYRAAFEQSPYEPYGAHAHSFDDAYDGRATEGRGEVRRVVSGKWPHDRELFDGSAPASIVLSPQQEQFERDYFGDVSGGHAARNRGSEDGVSTGTGVNASVDTDARTNTRRKNRRMLTAEDRMAMSQILPPKGTIDEFDDTTTPSADLADMSSTPSTPVERESVTLGLAPDDELAPTPETQPAAAEENEHELSPREDGAHVLARRLADIFNLEQIEDVLADFSCWLLQNTMLQGRLYITSKHACFYAYLPHSQDKVLHSGYLGKRGQQTAKYRRSWFILKNNVISYYANPAELYFLRGTIDLRHVLSVEAVKNPDGSLSRSFTVTTSIRSHVLRAESGEDAAAWVKVLKRAATRASNDMGSVKVLLPLRNILDVEESPVVDFADTLRIRIIEDDETFALEEHFFSFFGTGQEALRVLQGLIEPRPANNPQSIPDGKQAAATAQHVLPNSRQELEQFSTRNDQDNNKSSHATDSTSDISSQDSTASSYDRQTMPMMASQMLEGSTLFREPTLNQRLSSDSKPQLWREDSEDMVPTTKKSNATIQTPQTAETPPKAQVPPSPSATSLQQLVRAGVLPLNKASDFAGLLRTHSKRVGSLLALESRGYYDKVSGMWAGRRLHYNETEGLASSQNALDESKGASDGDRFRAHFSLPETERLNASYHGWLYRTVPIYGKIYVGETKLCFRGLVLGQRTKMILPIEDIENIDKENGFTFGYSGLVVVVQGHEEIFFEFAKPDARDDCVVTLLHTLEFNKDIEKTVILSPTKQDAQVHAQEEHQLLEEARKGAKPVNLEASVEEEGASPILFDDTLASINTLKRPGPLKIVCLTVGSRGDVQPYIALCKKLIAEGHSAKIVTHVEFEPWIRSHGVDFAPVAGDPAEIMRLCVEHDMFTVSFLREATSKFRGWIDQLLSSAWKSCQGADLLIESPSAMAGIHIAEAQQIPYFRAFTMPWTRTRAYPHAFAVPSQRMGGNYNTFSYVMFENVFWQAIAGQVNRWRAHTLSLPPTTLDKMQTSKVPFLYNFSPSVVAPPLDYNQWIRVTGYWFLDEGTDYEPPEELSTFIRAARAEGKKLVYVGFGSIVVEDPAALTATVVQSVLKADVRCILSKGWSERFRSDHAHESTTPEVPLPPQILSIRSAPHDWLFTQIDAAVHHGGAGTTGASLRAGIPTIVKPFFGDQFFFGNRVEDLGVGKCLRKLNVSVFARALWEVTNSVRMINKAARLGEAIRAEDGVATAIQAIYRDIDYAKSLVEAKSEANAKTRTRGDRFSRADDRIDDESRDESWTLVDDEYEYSEGEGPAQVEAIRRLRSVSTSDGHNAEAEAVAASPANVKSRSSGQRTRSPLATDGQEAHKGSAILTPNEPRSHYQSKPIPIPVSKGNLLAGSEEQRRHGRSTRRARGARQASEDEEDTDDDSGGKFEGGDDDEGDSSGFTH